VGVILKRCTYGAAVKDAKEQIIASIGRFNEIMRENGAKKSTNMAAKGKLRILIISEGGTSRREEKSAVDDRLFKELKASRSFEVELRFERKGPANPRAMFWYDEDHHGRNSCGVEFIAEFPESLTFKFLGFLGTLNLVKASAIRSISDSVLNRMQSLWEDVFRIYVGGAMTKSEQKFNLRKYEADSIVLNVFGNLIKLREY
jgi:hypothetical protein